MYQLPDSVEVKLAALIYMHLKYCPAALLCSNAVLLGVVL